MPSKDEAAAIAYGLGDEGEQLTLNTDDDALDDWHRISGDVNQLLRGRDEGVLKHSIEFITILLRGDMLGADDGDCILVSKNV